MLYSDIFDGKKVIVTGHTGFKGSWLTCWLKQAGANVLGISLDPPSTPSHFVEADIGNGIEDLRLDLRAASPVADIILSFKPDFVFHLAAQSIVKTAYEDPASTWSVNLFSTINLLEALRLLNKDCAVVIITSDKCYENVEWLWGYRENDRLGGFDPYSSSKAAVELAVASYVKSFFNLPKNHIRIATARAGNVIGGGDWAEGRIVVDIVKCWSRGDFITIKSPFATRPWQHVLEPVNAYLKLASLLKSNHELHGEAFNFGPASAQDSSVLDLVNGFKQHLPGLKYQIEDKKNKKYHEASLLKLNCDKAHCLLQWSPVLSLEETVQFTASWYRSFYEASASASEMTHHQIYDFIEKENLKQ